MTSPVFDQEFASVSVIYIPMALDRASLRKARLADIHKTSATTVIDPFSPTLSLIAKLSSSLESPDASLIRDLYRALDLLDDLCPRLLHETSLCQLLIQLVKAHFPDTTFSEVLLVFADILLCHQEWISASLSSGFGEIVLGHIADPEYGPEWVSQLITCAEKLASESATFRRAMLDGHAFGHVLVAASAVSPFPTTEVCYLAKALLLSQIDVANADAIILFLWGNLEGDAAPLALLGLTRALSVFPPLKSIFRTDDRFRGILDLVAADDAATRVQALRFLQALFEYDAQRVLEHITVEVLDLVAAAVRQEFPLAEEAFLAIGQLCQESPWEMAGRVSRSDAFDVTIMAIETAPFRGAGAAALVICELLRSRNEAVVTRAYDEAFDIAGRFLLESDVEGWRTEAMCAVRDFVHFLETNGKRAVVVEMAGKEWFSSAISEAVDGDAPDCLKNSCRFLLDVFRRYADG
jgi:hypothetical protein